MPISEERSTPTLKSRRTLDQTESKVSPAKVKAACRVDWKNI